jgi:hypothetical protein
VVTFDEARTRAMGAVGARWNSADNGTLYAAPTGFEDRTHFRVIVGSWESIVGHDKAYAVLDLPVVFVDKSTGDVELAPYITAMPRIDAMTPTG